MSVVDLAARRRTFPSAQSDLDFFWNADFDTVQDDTFASTETAFGFAPADPAQHPLSLALLAGHQPHASAGLGLALALEPAGGHALGPSPALSASSTPMSMATPVVSAAFAHPAFIFPADGSVDTPVTVQAQVPIAAPVPVPAAVAAWTADAFHPPSAAFPAPAMVKIDPQVSPQSRLVDFGPYSPFQAMPLTAHPDCLADPTRPDSPTIPFRRADHTQQADIVSAIELVDPYMATTAATSTTSTTIDHPACHLGSAVPALHSIPELSSPSLASSTAESTPAHSRKNSARDSNAAESDQPLSGPPFRLAHSRSHSFSGTGNKTRPKALMERIISKGTALSMKSRRKHSQTPTLAAPAGLNLELAFAQSSPAAGCADMENVPALCSLAGFAIPEGSAGDSDAPKERTPHTEVERKYRHGINDGITLLGNSVPELRQQIDAYNSEQDELKRKTAGPADGAESTDGDADADGASPGAAAGSAKSGSSKCKFKYPSKLAIIQGATDYIQRLETDFEQLRREHAALYRFAAAQNATLSQYTVQPGAVTFPVAIPAAHVPVHGL